MSERRILFRFINSHFERTLIKKSIGLQHSTNVVFNIVSYIFSKYRLEQVSQVVVGITGFLCNIIYGNVFTDMILNV
ncbi:MAG: hypothetical protein ACM3TR_05200 [Caulobacteraceae bacterium]